MVVHHVCHISQTDVQHEEDEGGELEEEEEKKIGPHPETSTSVLFTNYQSNRKQLTDLLVSVWVLLC